MNFLLHLDSYLVHAMHAYNHYFYLLLFIVIFCETGLVVTPFLPGDSLLFIAGSFAANGYLNLALLALIVLTAAFSGDNSNFFIGRFMGNYLFSNPKSKIFRRQFLDKTHDFYMRNGAITIVLARFLPIIRTFAPCVAGIAYMPYLRFIQFSIMGSALWIVTFLGSGYLFGNIPFIHGHLSIIILVVVVLSAIPIAKLVFSELRNRVN